MDRNRDRAGEPEPLRGPAGSGVQPDRRDRRRHPRTHTVTGQIHATTAGRGSVAISAALGSASAPARTTTYTCKCTDTTAPVISVDTQVDGQPADPVYVVDGDAVRFASCPSRRGCSIGSTQTTTFATTGSGAASGLWPVPTSPGR